MFLSMRFRILFCERELRPAVQRYLTSSCEMKLWCCCGKETALGGNRLKEHLQDPGGWSRRVVKENLSHWLTFSPSI